MVKKVLFEVRERSTDPAFQVVEDDNGDIQTHYGATYNSEDGVQVGARWNSTNTALVDPVGVNPYGKGTPDLDVNGNMIANIVPRHDTLTGLTAAADFGDGELATCSDVDAFVINRNGTKKTYYPGDVIGRSYVSFTATTIATGDYPGGSKVPNILFANKSDPLGMVNLATDRFRIPSNCGLLEIDILFGALVGGDATYCKCMISYDVAGGYYIPLEGISLESPSYATMTTMCSRAFIISPGASYSTQDIGLLFAHDKTTSMVNLHGKMLLTFKA